MRTGRAFVFAILVGTAGVIWWSYHILRGPDLQYDFRHSHLDRDVGWPKDWNLNQWAICRARSVSVDLPGMLPINRRDVAAVYFEREGSRLTNMVIALKSVDRQAVMLQGREIAAERHWPDPTANYDAWARFEKAFGPSSTCGLPNGFNVLMPPPLDIWAIICPGGGTPGDSYCIEINVHWSNH